MAEINAYIEDAYPSESDQGTADTCFRVFRNFVANHDPNKYPHGPMLGLAAGNAVAETALAKRFDISDITLVDKSKGDTPPENVPYIQQDLFSYLDTLEQSRYEVATVFGLEYLFHNEPQAWGKLWKGLEKAIQPGGYVFVTPIDSDRSNIPTDTSFTTAYADTALIIARKN